MDDETQIDWHAAGQYAYCWAMFRSKRSNLRDRWFAIKAMWYWHRRIIKRHSLIPPLNVNDHTGEMEPEQSPMAFTKRCRRGA